MARKTYRCWMAFQLVAKLAELKQVIVRDAFVAGNVPCGVKNRSGMSLDEKS